MARDSCQPQTPQPGPAVGWGTGWAQQHGVGDGVSPRALGHCSSRSPWRIPAPRTSVCCSVGHFPCGPCARGRLPAANHSTGFGVLAWCFLVCPLPPRALCRSAGRCLGGTYGGRFTGDSRGRLLPQSFPLGFEPGLRAGSAGSQEAGSCPHCEDGAPAHRCAHPAACAVGCADTGHAVPAAWGHRDTPGGLG